VCGVLRGMRWWRGGGRGVGGGGGGGAGALGTSICMNVFTLSSTRNFPRDVCTQDIFSLCDILFFSSLNLHEFFLAVVVCILFFFLV